MNRTGGIDAQGKTDKVHLQIFAVFSKGLTEIVPFSKVIEANEHVKVFLPVSKIMSV